MGLIERMQIRQGCVDRDAAMAVGRGYVLSKSREKRSVENIEKTRAPFTVSRVDVPVQI